jgi:hypothetical protein
MNTGRTPRRRDVLGLWRRTRVLLALRRSRGTPEHAIDIFHGGIRVIATVTVTEAVEIERKQSIAHIVAVRSRRCA